MDIFDFILLLRDRFYGGMGVWYYLPCGTGGGFPFSLASYDSGSVLAVKGPLAPLRALALDRSGPIRGDVLFTRGRGVAERRRRGSALPRLFAKAISGVGFF